MECNYVDYINIKKQLENTQKKLNTEQICHELTKKLCIFPTKFKN